MEKLATCYECGENRPEKDGQWKPWVDGVGNPLYVFICNKCSISEPKTWTEGNNENRWMP